MCPQVLALLVLGLTAAAQNIKIGVLRDPGAAEAGLLLDQRLEGLEAKLRELAPVQLEEFESIEDLEAEARADQLTAVLLASSCERSQQDAQRLKVTFPATVRLVARERGCPYSQDFDVALPYVRSVNDIVPLMADLKTGPISHWERVYLIHDNSLGLEDLETLVTLFMQYEASSVWTFNVGQSGTLATVLYAIGEESLKGDFLLLGADQTILSLLKEAEAMDLLDGSQEWMVVSLESSPTPDFQKLVSESRYSWNIAFVFPTSDGACHDERGCQVELLLSGLGSALAKLLEQGAFRTDTSAELELTRQHLARLTKVHLSEERGCGLCSSYAVKSASLPGSSGQTAAWHDVRKSVAEWTPLGGLQRLDHMFPASSGDFEGRHLTLAILHDPPLSKIWIEDGGISAEGFVVDIVAHLSKVMNFTYAWKMPQDEEYGLQQPDGSWSGVIGMLLNQEVDFVAMGLWPTGLRMQAVNFSLAIDEVSYQLLVKRPQQENRYLFLAPFTGEVSLVRSRASPANYLSILQILLTKENFF